MSKIQLYELRLKRVGVLRVHDSGGRRPTVGRAPGPGKQVRASVCVMSEKKLSRRVQIYECRLRKSGVLRVRDSAPERVTSPAGLAEYFELVFRGLPHEQFWVLLLDGCNQPLGLVRVGEGGLHGCALLPSDVLRPAVAGGARAIAVAHNHPSGDPQPSQEDWNAYRELQRAADVLGVALHDSLVLAGSRWFSMAGSERGVV